VGNARATELVPIVRRTVPPQSVVVLAPLFAEHLTSSNACRTRCSDDLWSGPASPKVLGHFQCWSTAPRGTVGHCAACLLENPRKASGNDSMVRKECSHPSCRDAQLPRSCPRTGVCVPRCASPPACPPRCRLSAAHTLVRDAGERSAVKGGRAGLPESGARHGPRRFRPHSSIHRHVRCLSTRRHPS